MARSAAEYKSWLDTNQDKAGTDLYNKIEQAYTLQSQEEQVAPDLGFFGNIRESITGTQRATPETETLPEWTEMPELNQLSVASAKTGLGTLLSNPKETVQIIQSNFPGVSIRTDTKGNFILRSSIDNQEYAIPPGFSLGDIPRAAGALAAFTPAGRAATIPGMVGAAGATQLGIETTQRLTGGDIDPAEVALAAGTAPILPVATAATKAVAPSAKELFNKLIGRSPESAIPKATAPSGNPAMTDALSLKSLQKSRARLRRVALTQSRRFVFWRKRLHLMHKPWPRQIGWAYHSTCSPTTLRLIKHIESLHRLLNPSQARKLEPLKYKA